MVRVGADGVSDRHGAESGQPWIVVEGRGWVAGGEDRRIEGSPGEVPEFVHGEHPAKGFAHGMTAVMIQIHHRQPVDRPDAA